jgi:PTS system mannitol-specific IIC component
MDNDLRLYVQRFGKFLSGMVMPNIGAFIAWGLITAFFIPTGWTPNATLSELVGPMIIYLLPLLIAYSGGKLVHGRRGGVIAAIATMGVIVGTGIPMFLGAMIMGPLAAVTMKGVDWLLRDSKPTGFEMLIDNFTAGILGMGLALLGLLVVGPVVEIFSNGLGNVVEWFVGTGFLPLASLFIEPAKILFLNNAINHGVLSPLGIAEVAEQGKSIFFLLEANPGPGLGILLAYTFFGKGLARASSPGSIVIHFFGGIHEIYFPYILMKPVLLLAVIAGGASGVLVFDLLNVGLVAPASPGSIFAVSLMAAKGSLIGLWLGVLVSAAVSFFVASFFLKIDKSEEEEDVYTEAKASSASMKLNSGTISLIAFACDAGMGSSAMGASALKSKFRKAGLKIDVMHCSLEEIPTDIKLVVTHKDLKARAQKRVPNAEIVTITNFVGAPEYDQLVEKLK